MVTDLRLAQEAAGDYSFGMSTLAEIEAAVKALPRTQQAELFAFLAERIGRSSAVRADGEDSFAPFIDAYAGPHEATGRRAEEILSGSAS
jgi:hypothetical protein